MDMVRMVLLRMVMVGFGGLRGAHPSEGASEN